LPEYQSDSGPDLASRLLRENAALTARVTALEGRRPTALDRVQHTTIPAPYEGQLVVELDDTVWYYSNSAWRQLGGGSAPSYAYLFSYVTPQTVTATSSLTLAWEDFTTNALTTVFTTGNITTSGINATGDTRLWCHSPGYYLIYGDIVWTDATYERYFYFDTTFYVFNQNEVAGGAAFPRDGVEPNNATALQERNTHAIMNTGETARKIRIIAYNRDSVSRDVRYATLAAVHWPMTADFAGSDVIYTS